MFRRILKSKVALVLVIALVVLGLGGCKARIDRSWGNGSLGGSRNDRYEVRDIRYAKHGVFRFTEIRAADSINVPANATPSTPSGLPLAFRMTAYVNCCGKNGTTTLVRNRCWDNRPSLYSCLAGYNSGLYLNGSTENDWCRYNGSLFFGIKFGTYDWSGHRYHYCDGNQSVQNA